jgi:Gas vesicle protein G
MGVIKELSLLPLAPLRFTVWVAGKVAEEADQQLNSPQARVRQLQEIEQARERGELDDEQAAELEAQVIARASGS